MNIQKLILVLLTIFNVSILYAQTSNSAIVFMYHRFGESTYPSTNITIEQFESQLEYLKSNDYTVLPLSKLLQDLIDKKEISDKTVCITIDDAYLSVYTKAYSILKQNGFEFTVFVSTSQVDSGSKNYMSWDMMREMKKQGIEFANHSLNHDYLLKKADESNEEWLKRVKKQINNAQKRLQEELGSDTNENPRMFSYPFGEYNEKIIEILKELNYLGITQTSGPLGVNTDLMRVPRFPMAEAFASKSGFITKLNTVEMPIISAKPTEPMIKENPPKLFIELKAPLKNLSCYSSDGKKIRLNTISETKMEVVSNKVINTEREKYTCTAPAHDSKWYWYSHLWINK